MADGEVGVMLWPLRAVSKDPSNLTKLDADYNVLTSTNDLDARYVNLTGDTMTGQLIVERDGAGTNAAVQARAYSETANCTYAITRTRGTKAAQAPLQVNDFVGRILFNTINTGGTNVQSAINCQVTSAASATGIDTALSFAVNSADGAAIRSAMILTKAGAGIGWTTPTRQLEVGGTAMVRGTLEVTDNITSSGTAHSFANGSIPSPAVIGNIPRTIAATGSAGSAGQMVWDDNFLYLRTTAGWKKVALTAI